MKYVTIPKDKMYIGIDVVKSVIDKNIKNHRTRNVIFLMNSGKQELQGDLLLLKDVLQHWPIGDIQKFVEDIIPNFKYVLVTNCCKCPGLTVNSEIEIGGYRPLDLILPPFNL